MPAGPDAWLVVGLGNPGPEYERTRHNAGYRVVDALASRLGVKLRTSRSKALVADARAEDLRVLLAKPTTFMNSSGDAVGLLARYFKVPVERVIVVHDDLDLPLGAMRVKRGGGTAGHLGLDSIVRLLGSPAFARVRVGIGRPPGRQDPTDYVLEPFRKGEEETVAVAFEEAADAALTIAGEGIAAAQNRFHAPR